MYVCPSVTGSEHDIERVDRVMFIETAFRLEKRRLSNGSRVRCLFVKQNVKLDFRMGYAKTAEARFKMLLVLQYANLTGNPGVVLYRGLR